jgi:hypothetical protein
MGFLLYLPAIIFLLIIIYIYKRDKTIFSFSGWILIVYFSSFIAAIILEKVYITGVYKIESSLYFIIVLLLFITPFLKIRGNKPIVINANETLIFKIAKVYAFLGILAVLYYLPSVKEALSGNLGFNRQLVGERSYVATRGIFAVIMSLIANVFPHNLLIYFYSIQKKWPKKWSILLLLSSLSFVTLSLANVGRDGIVLWSLTYISLYLLFKCNLTDLYKRKVRRTFYILLIPSIILFLLITFSRFSEAASYQNNPAIALLDYGGQQYRNFALQYSAHEISPENIIFNGARAFFLKLGILENHISRGIEYNELYMQKNYGTSLNVFSTFLGSLRLSIGNISTVIIGVIWFLMFSMFNKFNKFSTIFIYVFFYQIILHGIFYYRLGLGTGDFSLYLTFIIFLFLRFFKS